MRAHRVPDPPDPAFGVLVLVVVVPVLVVPVLVVVVPVLVVPVVAGRMRHTHSARMPQGRHRSTPAGTQNSNVGTWMRGQNPSDGTPLGQQAGRVADRAELRVVVQ